MRRTAEACLSLLGRLNDLEGFGSGTGKTRDIICELLGVEVSRNIFVCLCSSIETSACITWGPCIERREGAEGGAAPPRARRAPQGPGPPAIGPECRRCRTFLPLSGFRTLHLSVSWESGHRGSSAAVALRREQGKASALGGCELFRVRP